MKMAISMLSTGGKNYASVLKKRVNRLLSKWREKVSKHRVDVGTVGWKWIWEEIVWDFERLKLVMVIMYSMGDKLLSSIKEYVH